jgi:hypothetical protein
MADGSFSLGELPGGLYTLKAHHASGTGSASVHVTGSGPHKVEITARKDDVP